MKRAICFLCLLCLLVPAACAETVVTSFYPIYLLALNLCDGLEGVEVRNLAAPDFGCLHDYQLTVADMKALSRADVFLINGADMEEYLEHVTESLHLEPVDASGMGTDRCVTLIEEEDGETDFNPHIWLSAHNAGIMARNLADGLAEAMPDRAGAVRANLDAYLLRLDALDAELTARASALPRRDIVTFHEAVPYLAEAYGLNVAAVMATEPGEALSARDLMDLVKEERALGNPPLFTEPQYAGRAAQVVADETGARIYTLDPCVTGPADPPLTYYEDVMRANMAELERALGNAE